MLVINKEFIERCCSEYDRRNQGKYDQIEETAILNWVSRQSEPKFLNREYFIRLGRWKTPRYAATRETNDKHNIIATTRSAYLAKDDLLKLNKLKRLKGVGVAVASTILYYLQPGNFPIFDFHARHTLVKAGRLSESEDNDSDKVWLKYTKEIRRISSFHNKTIREVEKALFAYDKWGCGENEVGSKVKGAEMRKGNDKEELKVHLPSQKMRALETMAGEYGQQPATLASTWIIDRLQQCIVPSLSGQLFPESTSSQPAGEIIISVKVVAPDGEKEPRREIGRISKEDTLRLTCEHGPLSKYGATWNPEKTAFSIPIKLSIGPNEYDACFRCSKERQRSWIGSPLDGGKVKLAGPLACQGFKAGDEVKLKVVGNKIQVLKQVLKV